jgi:hypothetical protein
VSSDGEVDSAPRQLHFDTVRAVRLALPLESFVAVKHEWRYVEEPGLDQPENRPDLEDAT